MLLALGEIAAQKGYAACTITDIVTRAGVSRRTFYEHFSSKEACAIAGFEYGIELVVDRMSQATQTVTEGNWREYVRSSLDTYLQTLAAYPNAAWGFHVEAVNSGPVIYGVRTKFAAVLANRMREAYALARREDPARPELPDELFDVLLGGIDDRIRHCLHTRSAADLPELVPLLIQATFALFGAGPSSEPDDRQRES